MSLSLLGFGEDITKVRNELDVNIKLLRSPEIKQELFARTRKWFFKDAAIEETDSKKQDAYLEFIYRGVLLEILHELRKIPFLVNPASVIAIEGVYFLENLEKFLENPDEYAYFSTLTKKLERLQFFFIEAFMGLADDAEIENLANKWADQMSQDDPDFDYYFAFTLRQMPPQKVRSFLITQAKFWHPRASFLQFLKVVLIDYQDIIPQKNIILTKALIDEIYDRAMKQQSQQVNDTNNAGHYKTNLEIINDSPFSKPPFEALEIPGRLRPDIIRKFFSFLWIESNGAEEPFTKDEKLMEHLLKFGLQVPLKPLDKKFTLDLGGTKKSKKIIYHCFYQFYSKHAHNQAHKQYFAQFLLHTFSNFDDTRLPSIISNLREYTFTPRQLRFRIHDYLNNGSK